MYNLGILLSETDRNEARRWFEQAAEGGHAAAMFNLGVLLTASELGLKRQFKAPNHTRWLR